MTSIRPALNLQLLFSALLAHRAARGQLAAVKWEVEKPRLLGMLIAMMLVTIFLFCCLLSASTLILLYSWKIDMRAPVMLALVCFYGAGATLVWKRFQTLATRSDQAFADTREELPAISH